MASKSATATLRWYARRLPKSTCARTQTLVVKVVPSATLPHRTDREVSRLEVLQPDDAIDAGRLRVFAASPSRGERRRRSVTRFHSRLHVSHWPPPRARVLGRRGHRAVDSIASISVQNARPDCLPRCPRIAERGGRLGRRAAARLPLHVERDREAVALRGDLLDGRDLGEALLVGERVVAPPRCAAGARAAGSSSPARERPRSPRR